MKLSKKAITLASAFGAVTLLAVGATSASAAVTTSAYVENGVGWDPSTIVGSASGATTVSVDGDGFAGWTAVIADNGIYIAFGGENFTASDRNYYHSAAWASSTTGASVPLASGSFSGADVEIVPSYTDGDDNVIDCLTDANDTTGEQCYVYTFSGWGIFPNSTNDPNFTQVPVYFE